MKTIAVLLTVHNRKSETLNCLRGLSEIEVPQGVKLDIFLTDDGCTDGTAEAVSEQYPQVHMIQGDGNLYWNRGMYKAWEEAAKYDYDFYLWLNDDTYVYKNLLTVLLEAVEQTNNQSIIVGCTQSINTERITYGGRLANGQIPTPNGRLEVVHHFNGNIVFIPKSVYKQVGNLDYYFRHSKGDFDYGMRSSRLGIKAYQAGQILGCCDSHDRIDKWCDPKVPLRDRWKAMKRPTGMPPKEIYHMNINHKGFISAVVHYMLVYVRCVFPQLWLKH